MKYLSKVINKTWLTHNVFHLSIEKPKSFKYKLGQAVELSLQNNSDVLMAPFTITSIYEKDFDLQFIIKVYPKHNGITLKLAQLKVNNTLFISNPWDSFTYAGPGVFIAAGSGITPFYPTLRLLKEQNRIRGHQLIYANKEAKDIILFQDLKYMLGKQFFNILSRDHLSQHARGHIDKENLIRIITVFNQNFYVCGPLTFLENTKKHLLELGVKKDLIQSIY